MPIKKFKEMIFSQEKIAVVFDLDDTITPFLQPISENVLGFLRFLETLSNLSLIINSMQTCEFLSGIWRQAALRADRWILIGENGAELWYEAQMPCKKFIHPLLNDLNILQRRLNYFHQVKTILAEDAYFYDVSYGTTAFVAKQQSLEESQKLLTKILSAGLVVEDPFFFIARDFCLELGIKGINKHGSLALLKEQAAYDKIIAFGDSPLHDWPMLLASDLGIYFGKIIQKTELKHIYHLRDIDEFVQNLGISF